MRVSNSSAFIGALVSAALLGCTGNIEDADPNAAGTAGVSNGKAGNGPIGGPGGGGASGGSSGSPTSGSGGVEGPGPAAGTGAGAGVGAGGGGVASCDGLTERRVRRLSRREYSNVVGDLLGAPLGAEAHADLPFEPRIGGFDNQNSELYVSPSYQSTLADLAEKLASKVDPTTAAPCTTSGGSPACLQTFIKSLATKAYGRPPTEAEIASLSTVAATGESYATSVRLVVEVVLQQPQFVYVSELGPVEAAAAPGHAVPLTPYEIASQLSFLLLGTRPDADLIKAAETSRFATAADIQAQVERLLKTERAKTDLARFVVGWLDMAAIAEAPKAADAYPELTPAVTAAMQQEFDSFVATQLKGGDGVMSSFLSAVSTNVPAALAPIYGADLNGATLNPERRRGVLSLPGFLTFHSTDHSSGPVERGLFVRTQLFCQPVPPPPPEVVDRLALMPIGAGDAMRTTRQKFEMHLDEASCRACHAAFDPIGFGMESMDGLGRFRTVENGLPVNSKGELSGTDVDGPFEGPGQLAEMLSKSSLLETCMVDHFFRFAQARATTASDKCVVDDWKAKFTQGGGRMKDLIYAYVTHSTFANRKDDR